MGFFSRKHKLPRFPATLIPTFRRLCEPLPVSALQQVRTDFDQCLATLESMAESNPRISRPLLNEISERARMLLARYEEFSGEQRALIIGALRYFAIVADTLPDDKFSSGLDDDAKVFNYVLETLGIEDCYIALA